MLTSLMDFLTLVKCNHIFRIFRCVAVHICRTGRKQNPTLRNRNRAVPLYELEKTTDGSPHPGPAATFALAPGTRLEPLGDGSAVLYSKELDQSLSLNHTAALLCSYADGRHTISTVLQEMRQIFPEDPIEEDGLLEFLAVLEARHFLQWREK